MIFRLSCSGCRSFGLVRLASSSVRVGRVVRVSGFVFVFTSSRITTFSFFIRF